MFATATLNSSTPRIPMHAVGSDILDLIDHRPPAKRCFHAGHRREAPPPAVSVPDEQAVAAVDLLKGRWTLEVLWALRGGPVRLGQLHRLFPASSKKVLTQTLRKLEQCRLLYRSDLSGRTRHVEYHLVPGMRTEVCSLLDQFKRWGEACQRNGLDTAFQAEAGSK